MALLDDYRLTDRYLKDQGTTFLTGIQALARVAVRRLLKGLTAETLDAAVTTTSAAMNVKGYEALKVASGRALLDAIGGQTPPIPET